MPHLPLGSDPAPYTLLLGMLLALFVGRVLGQVLAATIAPAWLPPMRRWYSGLMPYRYLLPAQVVIIALMLGMIAGVSGGSGPLGRPDAAAGRWLLSASCVYAAGMVVRAVRYATAPPERRGVLIPIVFHFVLAGFLFVYGSWHVVNSRPAP